MEEGQGEERMTIQMRKTGWTSHTVRNKSGMVGNSMRTTLVRIPGFWWESQVSGENPRFLFSRLVSVIVIELLFVKHMMHPIKSYLLSNSFRYFMWNSCNERKCDISIFMEFEARKTGFELHLLTLGESFHLSEPVSLFVKLIP